ncbi:MAG: enhanced intracellular survival protein Eis [Candidatus Dormibacteria bacterium]
MDQDHSPIEIRDADGERDLQRFAEVDAESFAGQAATNIRWLAAAAPHAPLRLAHTDGEIVGGYMVLPVGQFFGGKSVPAQAVTAVAVHPAWRRQGVAGALMRDCVRLAREHEAAVAPLHATTVRLYRRWGWEVCSQTLRQIVRTRALTGLSGSGRIRAKPDRPAVEAMRRAHLAKWDGPLDRPDWFLSVEWDPGDPEPRRSEYGWYEGNELTGFVRYESEREPGSWIRLRVQEFIFTTHDALVGLLGFLGGQDSMGSDVVFVHSAVTDASPLLWILPEPHRNIEVQGFVCWLQRIVNIDRAMSSRGWPARAAGRVDLEITDPVTGLERVVLEVEGGCGRVTPGGTGAIRCGIGALSAWYSSAMRAQDAVRLGLLDGEPSLVTAMDGLIAGGLPWMPDFF